MNKPYKYISQKMTRASGMEAWVHVCGFYWHRPREPDKRLWNINMDPFINDGITDNGKLLPGNE